MHFGEAHELLLPLPEEVVGLSWPLWLLLCLCPQPGLLQAPHGEDLPQGRSIPGWLTPLIGCQRGRLVCLGHVPAPFCPTRMIILALSYRGNLCPCLCCGVLFAKAAELSRVRSSALVRVHIPLRFPNIPENPPAPNA